MQKDSNRGREETRISTDVCTRTTTGTIGMTSMVSITQNDIFQSVSREGIKKVIAVIHSKFTPNL